MSSSAGDGVWGLLAIVAALAPKRPVIQSQECIVASAVPWEVGPRKCLVNAVTTLFASRRFHLPDKVV